MVSGNFISRCVNVIFKPENILNSQAGRSFCERLTPLYDIRQSRFSLRPGLSFFTVVWSLKKVANAKNQNYDDK